MMKKKPAAPAAIDLLPDARRSIMVALKRVTRATIPQLAAALSVSTEAIRQQLSHLQRGGWISADCGPDETALGRTPGRPPTEYCLSPAAEDLFPKRYAELTLEFFDAVSDVEKKLAEMTDERVTRLEAALTDQPLVQRMQTLRSIYVRDDPHTEVEKSAYGYRLIERNCPYLQFATERPLFCSTTVSALRRLTNREVVREERFQDGEGRCVFHVYADAKITHNSRFEREPAKDARPEQSRQR